MRIQWTLKRKLLILSAFGAAGTVVTGVTGAFGLQRSHATLEIISEQARAQRLQMDADMMHDAVRGDVLRALLAVRQEDVSELRDARAELAAHASRFQSSLREAWQLLPDSVRSLQPELETTVTRYLTAASVVVEAGGRGDEGGAEAAMPTFTAAFDELEDELEAFGNQIERQSAVVTQATEGVFARLRWLLFGVGSVIVAFVLAFGRRVSSGIVASSNRLVETLSSLRTDVISRLEVGMEGLARGEVQALSLPVVPPMMIRGTDELATVATTVNEIARAANAMADAQSRAVGAIRGLLSETDRVVEAARDGLPGVRADSDRYAGAFGALLARLNDTIAAWRAPVDAALTILESAAERNLSARVAVTFPGEHARLANAVNTAIGNIADALHEVEVAAEQITGAAQQVSDGSQSMAEGAARQRARWTRSRRRWTLRRASPRGRRRVRPPPANSSRRCASGSARGTAPFSGCTRRWCARHSPPSRRRASFARLTKSRSRPICSHSMRPLRLLARAMRGVDLRWSPMRCGSWRSEQRKPRDRPRRSSKRRWTPWRRATSSPPTSGSISGPSMAILTESQRLSRPLRVTAPLSMRRSERSRRPSSASASTRSKWPQARRSRRVRLKS